MTLIDWETFFLEFVFLFSRYAIQETQNIIFFSDKNIDSHIASSEIN